MRFPFSRNRKEVDSMKKIIPDCYWPDSANGAYVSHEAVCVLNTGTEEITVELTLYFEDRDKMGGQSTSGWTSCWREQYRRERRMRW